jgi:hypothetical protein
MMLRVHMEQVSLCDGEVRATFFPAVHVLGAACVGIGTSEGNVLITGDVSVTDQLTLPGLRRPAFAPDLLASPWRTGTSATRVPSMATDRKHVKLTVDRLPPPDMLGEAVERFKRETDFTLRLEEATGGTPVARSTYDDTGRMEVNLAFAEIARAFADETHRPYGKMNRAT